MSRLSEVTQALNNIEDQLILANKFVDIEYECSVDTLNKYIINQKKGKSKPVKQNKNGRLLCGDCDARLRARLYQNSKVSTFCDKCGMKVDYD